MYNQLDLQIIENLNSYAEDFFRVLSSINEIGNTPISKNNFFYKLNFQDNSKELLCMTNFLETAIDFIEKNTSNDDLLRNFGGFLTNLLANNDNTDIIYKYRNNFILDKAIEWFENFQNEQLYLASTIIIANYMQNGKYSLKQIDIIKFLLLF